MTKSSAQSRLIKAFFNLLEDKHYSKICVSDLISEASCSRTTFYRHYTDVIDMYNKICEQLAEGLIKELALSFSKENYVLSDMFDEFCQKLESQKKYISLLCGKNGDRRFFEIGLSLSEYLAKTINPFLSEIEMFTVKFIVSSTISTYVKCLLDETEFDRRYLVVYKNMLTEAQKAGEALG